MTPPDELAATDRTGSIPTDKAVTFCRFPNSRLADVSEPVIKTPSQPRTGEKKVNIEPVSASVMPSVVLIPEELVTYAKPTTEAIVKIGNFNSFSVSLKTAPQSFHEIDVMNFDSTAAIKIAVPAEPSTSSL